MVKIMTPEEFAEEMRKLVAEWGADAEAFHYRADELMTCVLCSLGYFEGVKVFDDADKWYA
jgi:hypothetical protein